MEKQQQDPPFPWSPKQSSTARTQQRKSIPFRLSSFPKPMSMTQTFRQTDTEMTAVTYIINASRLIPDSMASIAYSNAASV